MSAPLLAALAVAVVLGCGTAAARAEDPQLTPPEYLDQPVPPGFGAGDVYRRDCGYCHGIAGEGTARGPDLRGVGRASADYWIGTGRMPLSSPESTIDRRPPAYPPAMVDALVDYVAAFGPGGEEIPEVDVRAAHLGRGLEIYQQQCAACHVWSGVGGALLYREAPRVTDATATQVAEAVRIGPGNMPAFGKAALPDNELNDLVAYTRSLDRPVNRGGDPLWHFGPLAEGLIAWLVGMGTLVVAVVWIGERQ